MLRTRSYPSEKRLAPGSRAVTGAEYGLWRADADLAYALRHGLLDPPAPTLLSGLARLAHQTIGHLAASYLRTPGAAERVFGRPGRCTFLHRFVVEGHWEVRADVVFWPDDGTGVTLARVLDIVGPGESLDDADATRGLAHELAYQSFTLRRLGVDVAACGLLRLHDAAGPTAFDYLDVSAALDRVDGAHPTATAAVAAEVDDVRAYLHGPSPTMRPDLSTSSFYRPGHRADASVHTAPELEATLTRLGIGWPG